MKEEFLQFVWKYRLFDNHKLLSVDGEEIEVLNPGEWNHDAGPDFFNAMLKVGGMMWVGNVEIHNNSSDWYHHKHHEDGAYNNVILHVVADVDHESIFTQEGRALKQVVIKDQVNEQVVKHYGVMFNQKTELRCANAVRGVPSVNFTSMLDKTACERLEMAAGNPEFSLTNTSELGYQLLCKAFGFHLNSEPFLELSYRLPFRVVRKYLKSNKQTMALIFGVSGFLKGEAVDAYHLSLKKEYAFLKQKHRLEELPDNIWKFSATRSGNLPHVRLAQLASFLVTNKDFTKVLLNGDVAEAKAMLTFPFVKYWQSHKGFGVWSSHGIGLGEVSQRGLLVNFVAKYWFVVSGQVRHTHLKDKALDLLQELKPEHNKVTRLFTATGLRIESSWQSQGALHLYRYYCQENRCLQCKLGASILHRAKYSNNDKPHYIPLSTRR